MAVVINKTVTEKYVSIVTNGPIIPLGCIYGPTIPKIMSTSEIAILIQKHYKVVEYLTNGETVVLDMTNYNTDLNGDGGESLAGIKPAIEEPIAIPVDGKAAAVEQTTATDKSGKNGKTDSTTTVTGQAAKDDKTSGGKTTVVVSTSASKADTITSKK